MKLCSLACVFTVLLFALPPLVNTEIMGSCSFQGLDLEKCINEVEISKNLDSCCVKINQAIKTGFYCVCSLLASSAGPLLRAPLSLLESNCNISIPPLAQCQALFPSLLHPQASDPDLQVLLSPQISIFLQSLRAPPPQSENVRLNSTSVVNSTVLQKGQFLSNNSATDWRVFTSKCEFSSGHKTMNSMFLHLFAILAI